MFKCDRIGSIFSTLVVLAAVFGCATAHADTCGPDTCQLLAPIGLEKVHPQQGFLLRGNCTNAVLAVDGESVDVEIREFSNEPVGFCDQPYHVIAPVESRAPGSTVTLSFADEQMSWTTSQEAEIPPLRMEEVHVFRWFDPALVGTGCCLYEWNLYTLARLKPEPGAQPVFYSIAYAPESRRGVALSNTWPVDEDGFLTVGMTTLTIEPECFQVNIYDLYGQETQHTLCQPERCIETDYHGFEMFSAPEVYWSTTQWLMLPEDSCEPPTSDPHDSAEPDREAVEEPSEVNAKGNQRTQGGCNTSSNYPPQGEPILPIFIMIGLFVGLRRR